MLRVCGFGGEVGRRAVGRIRRSEGWWEGMVEWWRGEVQHNSMQNGSWDVECVTTMKTTWSGECRHGELGRDGRWES